MYCFYPRFTSKDMRSPGRHNTDSLGLETLRGKWSCFFESIALCFLAITHLQPIKKKKTISKVIIKFKQ